LSTNRSRVSDPHPFHGDPDPGFYIFADPDTGFEIFAEIFRAISVFEVEKSKKRTLDTD